MSPADKEEINKVASALFAATSMDAQALPAMPAEARLDQDNAPPSEPDFDPPSQRTQAQPQEEVAMAQPQEQIKDAQSPEEHLGTADDSARAPTTASATAIEEEIIDLDEAEELADAFDEIQDRRQDAPDDQPLDDDLQEAVGDDQLNDLQEDQPSADVWEDMPTPEDQDQAQPFAQRLAEVAPPASPPDADPIPDASPSEQASIAPELAEDSSPSDGAPLGLSNASSADRQKDDLATRMPTDAAWSEQLQQLQRRMLIGFGALAALALGLFGLGWWLLGAGAGAGVSPGASQLASELPPGITQMVESRLATIEGEFGAAERRLEKLEQQASALREFFAGSNRNLPSIALSALADDQTPQPAPASQPMQEMPDSSPPEPALAPSEPLAAPQTDQLTGQQTSEQASPDSIQNATRDATRDAIRADAQQPQVAPQDESEVADAQASMLESGTPGLTPASNSLVLNSVRYGIQLGAFELEESARQLVRQKSPDGQSLYFFRSGPNEQMIAVIQGLYSNNQEVSRDLIEVRRNYPEAWPRRFDPGTELTLFNPSVAP